MLSTSFVLAGCGAFLSLSGDDEDDPVPTIAVDPDAGKDPTNGDGSSIIDGAADDGSIDANADVVSKSDAGGDAGAFLGVFVTSTLFAGDKLSSPDSLCMTAKNTRPGAYRAWISHSLRQAANNITGDGPWKLFDGTLVAANKAQLLSGQLSHAIDLDENGKSPTGFDPNVWTGTSEQGTTLFHCNQWSQADGGLQGTFGSRFASSKEWTNGGQATCFASFRIYCFQIPE